VQDVDKFRVWITIYGFVIAFERVRHTYVSYDIGILILNATYSVYYILPLHVEIYVLNDFKYKNNSCVLRKFYFRPNNNHQDESCVGD